MARSEHKDTEKGSQKQLQLLVNRHADVLNELLRPHLPLRSDDEIQWLSPLEEDNYAEYSDRDFLERLSIRLEKQSLSRFWPVRGPVWDGLGKTRGGDVILVEAKSHVSEVASSCKAGRKSLKLIQDSLAKTSHFYGASSNADWLNGYYQYANRLAHLYLLRELNGIPAWLCFVNFVNDHKMSGPQSVDKWQTAIGAIHKHLGVTEEVLRPHVVDVFPDVKAYKTD